MARKAAEVPELQAQMADLSAHFSRCQRPYTVPEETDEFKE